MKGYRGWCIICGKQIAIREKWEASEAGFWHQTCEPKAAEVCTTCFQEKAANGTCGCY